MLFNSLDFAIFLPVVFIFYWFVLNDSVRLQNILIVVASYIFYGWWDWRFLSLIFFSSVVDYLVGLSLSKTEKGFFRTCLLVVSIVANIGLLGFFKYYNFFIDSFDSIFSLMGYSINSNSLNIILPVGISFYTFQTLSYSIDVYKGKLEPTKDFVAFSAFVSFFPQLVAGPIERAKQLLPQFYIKRNFDYSVAVDGLRQILWGFFKKLVIADNCAIYANMIFNDSGTYEGSTLFLGAIFFAFQIYGDFSGYSDIAIGISKLFGFNLMQNFAYPYFSRDIAEFWRRWHISLSTWFRDYLYIPLGGSRGPLWKKVRNVFLIFTISGLWHGANWTFVVWGLLNALYFLPLLLRGRNRHNLGDVATNKKLPSLKELFQMLFTFCLTIIAWIFFRSESISQSIGIIREIFSTSFFTIPIFFQVKFSFVLSALILVFITVEWFGRREFFALNICKKIKFKMVRWTIYLTLIFLIGMFMSTNENQFLYFQF